jgi:hypothetical protein
MSYPTLSSRLHFWNFSIAVSKDVLDPKSLVCHQIM